MFAAFRVSLRGSLIAWRRTWPPCGGCLKRRAGVGVDEFAAGDVGVGPLHQQARVLTVEQRAGDSAGPRVDALAGVLGDLMMDDHVGQLQPTARSPHAV